MTVFMTRIFWWVLPRVLGGAVDMIGKTLLLVESAESIEDPTARRRVVLEAVGGFSVVPEPIRRGLVEFCVVLNRMGVTSEQLEAMEKLVSQEAATSALADTEKRSVVLASFANLFPGVPERVCRLLLEFAVAKVTLALGKTG